ncbi:MAG TPA: CNNM domain-containing protein, partial [Actinotalea sp.]|nr:CNNM domain-containing protein [Actinotalea sp.]
MTGAPTAALLTGAIVAVLLAALLSAGETGLLRLGRAAQAEIAASATPGARRVQRLLVDPHTAASAAGAVRVVLESVAAVCLTLAVVATGADWWLTLLTVSVLVAVAGLLVVRHLPRRVARHHPAGAVLLTSALLVLARRLAGPVRVAERTRSDQHDLNHDDIRDMVDRVSESEHIEQDEREMFRSVLELGDTLTRAVMVP